MATGSLQIAALSGLGLLLAAANTASALDWPNYRGPDHNGISK